MCHVQLPANEEIRKTKILLIEKSTVYITWLLKHNFFFAQLGICLVHTVSRLFGIIFSFFIKLILEFFIFYEIKNTLECGTNTLKKAVLVIQTAWACIAYSSEYETEDGKAV